MKGYEITAEDQAVSKYLEVTYKGVDISKAVSSIIVSPGQLIKIIGEDK